LSQLSQSIPSTLANSLSTAFGFVPMATVLAVLILVAKGCAVG
jgi:hypothetical protein